MCGKGKESLCMSLCAQVCAVRCTPERVFRCFDERREREEMMKVSVNGESFPSCNVIASVQFTSKDSVALLQLASRFLTLLGFVSVAELASVPPHSESSAKVSLNMLAGPLKKSSSELTRACMRSCVAYCVR